jgi:anti-sigma factor RsiW
MNDIFQCGDSAALVAYLYDECAPGEQAVIAAHIKGCATCASEVDALTATRRTLASWTPPDLALGFQITRDDELRPAKVLTPAIAWWRAPMPAWAQAAAALAIFGAGLSVGAVRNAPAPQHAATVPQTPPVAQVAPPPRSSVSADDLAQLEQRIRTELTQLRSTNTAVPAAARGSDDALMQQVKTLIDQSEENQRRDFTLRMVDLAGNIETQRRVDLATVRQQIGLQERSIGTELRQQREVLGRLVSERTR